MGVCRSLGVDAGFTPALSRKLIRKAMPSLHSAHPIDFAQGPAMKTYRIATIPGDGIGKEVVPAGQQVLEALAI